MPDPIGHRRISVSARDQAGKLISGATFIFSLGSDPLGDTPNSDGRADITFPSDTGPVTVTVQYGRQTQTVTLDVTQTSHVFQLTRRTLSKRSMAALVMLGLVVVVVGLILATRWILRPEPTDTTQQAMTAIARQCAGGQVVGNESEITATLSDYVSKVSAGAQVRSSDVGVVTSRMQPDGFGRDMYRDYTACLATQTQAYLQMTGVQVAPAVSSQGSPAMPGHATSTADADGRIVGWSYYEESDGNPTDDGKLMPRGAKAPTFLAVREGTVLFARQMVQIRAEPNSNAEVVGQLPINRCVRVVTQPDTKSIVPVGNATSGGWLRVMRVACPT